MDALVLLAIGLAAGLVFSYSQSARDWAILGFGFAWIPFILWSSVLLLSVRYNRHAVSVYWRRWTAAAVGMVIIAGILSTIQPSNGVFSDSSLAGEWGRAIGGSPAILAAGKLLAIAVLAPLALRPKLVGRAYLRGSLKTLSYLQLSLVYLYMGIYQTGHFMERRFRMARYAMYRRKPGATLARLILRRSSPAPVRTPAYQDHDAPVPQHVAPDAEANHWETPESGEEPNWEPEPTAPARVPAAASPKSKKTKSGWQLPSIDVLSPPDTHHAPEAALQQMALLVETTLGDHGVRVDVTDIKAGPRIVRFGLVPGWVTKRGDAGKVDSGTGVERSRVKVQSILIREKDMALALKTPNLRIEAPVPGEALVGLEVPNPSPSKVHLREIMETPAFGRLAAKGGLPIALGQDTGGSAVALDLAALPHILIAGATGSGKSVCINSIVASFLLTKPPDQLRLLMVDPKRVELTPFNGIPHLIAPVIVNTEEVNSALRGLIREMLRRYKLMEETGARNIEGFNRRSPEKMPFLVLIVDELADLMITGGFEVEQNLVRLAQLGRATGIHLVLATQRPSVNVVTGLLKANIPARAAFAVASQVDSRVILDGVGAEKLLGKGDMLLLHNESPKPRRVQGTLVYDQEIDQMVEFWLGQAGPPVPVIDVGDGEDGEDGESGESGPDAHMMEEARELAVRNPELTSSFLERRLKIGGKRAAEIIETLEEEGFLDGD